jgi:hypothetical protein
VAGTADGARIEVTFNGIAQGYISDRVGALLLEQNDEWAVQRARYMTLETIAPMGEDTVISLPAVAS